MRFSVLTLFLLFALPANYFSQSSSQPQGEYHRNIVKKTDMERRKLKHKDYVGGGIILFSKKDIPREGKTKEVEMMLRSEFKADEKFVGRIYLPRAVDLMDNKTPEAIAYRIYVDNAATPMVKQISNKKLPDATWSSWLLDFPDNFQTEMNSIGGGTHSVRIELWSINAYEDADSYEKRLEKEAKEAEEAKQKEKEAQEAQDAAATENNRETGDKKTAVKARPAPKPHPVAKAKVKEDKVNKDHFWAMGEFTLVK